MWSTLKSWDKEGYSIACGSRGNYQATTVSVVNEVAVGGVGSRVLMFVEELIFERIQIQGLMLQVSSCLKNHRQGIIAGHAYTMLRTVEVQVLRQGKSLKFQMLHVRNPHMTNLYFDKSFPS